MRLSRIGMASAVAAFMLLGSHGFAEPTGATGSISGTVFTRDGKPASGVAIKVAPDTKVKSPTAADGDKKPAEGDKKKREKVPGLTTTTDADGHFKLENVPTGQYVVTATLKDVGRAKVSVAVSAGRNSEIKSIQLAPPKAKT